MFRRAIRTPLLAAVAVAVGLLLFVLTDRSSRLTTAVNSIGAQVGDLIGLAKSYDREISERILQLPEDGQVWSTVFVWPENREADSHSRRLAALFAAEPRLRSLLAQTKSTHYTPSDPLYKTRYAQSMGGSTPQFWLVQPDANPSTGKAVYAVAGAGIPASGRQMADSIAGAIARICPRPKPVPEPVAPVPVPEPVVPDLTPAEPIDDSLPVWVWILPVLAAGAGALAEWRRNA